MKKILLACFALLLTRQSFSQETYPVNGSWDVRSGQYAFTNANIVVSAGQTITNGTLIIKDGYIESVASGASVPKGYVTVDLKGKYIYPGLIDAYTTYGMPEAPRQAGGFGGFGRAAVPVSTKPGPYGWNEAIRPDVMAVKMFHVNPTRAEELKRNGFGAVQALVQDGIARGTSAVLTLANASDNEVLVKDEAAAHYSFSKGTAATNYPSSLMGSIALLRQTYYDAAWYKTQKKEYNISLAEFNRTQALPQIFEVSDVQSVLRADKIAKEFGKQYIYKTDGQEYQRIDAIKALNASFIVPLSFPAAFDVEDALDARNVGYAQLKNWELAPTNPAALEKAGIRFALTSNGLTNARDFWTNLRTAITNGLSEKQALMSLTEVPAQILGVSDKVGTLAKGKLANFIITSGTLFKADNVIYENWVQGQKFVVSKMDVSDLRGTYTLSGSGLANTTLVIGGTPGAYTANINRTGTDSTRTQGTIVRTGDLVSLYFDLKNKPSGNVRLNGYITSTAPLALRGTGTLPDGGSVSWTATYTGAAPAGGRGGRGPGAAAGADQTTKAPVVGPLIYPFSAFGNTEMPKTETTLFRNATVWTNEKEGVLQNADVLIEGGKIKAVGKNLAAGGARVIDATGKHITAGIIDEHSHIAASNGINEGTQSVTSEVRIADVIDAEDVNIYRQLAGGVTTSHILHGSANAIGGQTQLIKLRWGVMPEQMKFAGSDGFIKFALGENVTQKNRTQSFGDANVRFPQSRMGVEQVYVDAFTRAKEYKAARAVKGSTTRRDLELDALVEILDAKRFITCHSYVQSEINMLMHVADSMGFKINTFTHILEGYKVADKMKARKIAGSTFSDWWAYKYEVAEAIPYNGKLMHEVGVVTGFNSDDAEMARRLNQEAAKAITYGKLSEEDALKLVTLNPAKMLHIDSKVGSLKPGKDADVVVWSANPLSIYAVVEKTYVDGVPYWDYAKDAEKQKAMKADAGRIVQKMIESKGRGAATQRPAFQRPRLYECESVEDAAYIIADDYNGMKKQVSAENHQ
ncbi:amidohydrolase family protein [uncultured Mucilaginibacter sp.]|uniref:amidohydrolase family protein n=1 Tax=uncultured Mucilaginibacter sp. TaxID=797541 RepID=UPI0025FA565D|nr:amidohydrolase family protein [uncultured Mucilaginibacter sp.]